MILPATPDAVARAAALLRGGDVVAFPTETVYGLGADATNPAAVARVFEVKERPSFDPLIVHLAAIDDWPALVSAIPEPASRLAARFWPGPLTIVLPKADRIPDIVTAGLPSVAVRMPDHAVARELIAATGRPIAAPSANLFGAVSPTTAAHVDAQLGERVPLILDGGPCRVGLESTVLSFVDAEPQLLRPGGIAIEDIEREIGPVRVAVAGARPLAPGQLLRHYAPRTPLMLVGAVAAVPPAARSAAALLCVFPAAAEDFAHVEVLAPDGDPRRAAANLFAAIRRLDAAGYAHIYALAVPERGLCRAIMDRLRRAQHDGLQVQEQAR